MIRITALGSVRVLRDGSDVPLAGQQPKRLALLAYLAAARPFGSHRRDTLVALLWPEHDQERARAALRQAMYALRKAFGADVIVSDGTESVRLEPTAVACDLWGLEAAAANGEHERVAQLHEGELFSGLLVSDAPAFADWLDRERTRLRTCARESMLAAAEIALRATRASDAVAYTRRALALAELDERVLRRAMCLLAQAGERASALAEYERFASVLRHELDVEPAGQTRALAAELRRPTPVPALSDAVVHTALSHEPPPRARSRWARRRHVVAAAISIVAIAVAARLAPSASARLDPRHVRVASFTLDGSHSALDTIAHAVEWATRSALVRLDNVRVAADNSEIRAGTDVRGSVRAVQDSIELHAEVVDRVSGAILRLVTTRIARDADSRTVEQHVGAFGDRVSAAVATALYPGWGTALSQPPSYAGYRLFLDGMRSIKLEQHEAATAAFRRAFAEDSSFTVAGLLAAAELYQMARFAAADSIARSIAPRRALLPAVDGHLLDWVTRSLAGDRIGARTAMAAIVRIAPTAELAWLQLAIDNVETARPSEALAVLEHVSENADLTEGWASVWATRAEALHLLGEHERELAAAREGLQRHPELRVLVSYELRALAALGRVGDVEAAARSLGDGSVAGKGDVPQVLRQVALELAAHGQGAAARRMLARARAWYATRPDSERRTLDFQLGFARTLFLANDGAAARAIYDSLLVAYPKCLDCVGVIGVLAARAGDKITAERNAALLAASTRRFLFGRNLMWAARIAAVCGDSELASSRLNAAFAAGAEFDVMTHADPDLASINPDSTYRVFARAPQPSARMAVVGSTRAARIAGR